MSLDFTPVLHVLGASVLLMLVGWEVQRRTRNAGIVDVLWTVGMGGAAVYYATIGTGALLPRLLLGLLAGSWALRLLVHLLRRYRREGEDGRYAYLRQHWSDRQSRFLVFFLAQAIAVALFSLPFLVVSANPKATVDGWVLAGIAVFVLALSGEGLADRQLERHRADPARSGQTCREGLWRYSRHPNYFFEWLHWFAWVLLGVGAPYGWLTLLGPALMGASLAWVTGIPFTEAQALRSRGEDYRRYQQETSVFFPWPPRRREEK